MGPGRIPTSIAGVTRVTADCEARPQLLPREGTRVKKPDPKNAKGTKRVSRQQVARFRKELETLTEDEARKVQGGAYNDDPHGTFDSGL